MSSSEQYKRQIMNDLASGNAESLEDAPINSEQEYENFDDLLPRAHRTERQLFGRFTSRPHPQPNGARTASCDRPKSQTNG